MRRLPLLCLLLAAPTFAQQPRLTTRVAGWPGVFHPRTVLELHLYMAPADWKTIQNDDTLLAADPDDQMGPLGDEHASMIVSTRCGCGTLPIADVKLQLP